MKYHATFPLILGLLLLALALPVIGSFTDGWGEYQDEPLMRGFVSDETGQWTNVSATSYVNDGRPFQPIALDLDGDGTIEIVGSDGNNLIAWGLNNRSMVIRDTLAMNGTQGNAMTALSFQFDSDNRTELAVIMNHYLHIVEWNGTRLVIQNSTRSLNYTPSSGIRCGQFGASYACYWMNYGYGPAAPASVNATITEVNLATMGFSQYTILLPNSSAANMNDQNNYTPPAMDDIDRDGSQELVFMQRPTGGASARMYVWDQTAAAGNSQTTLGGGNVPGEIVLDSTGTPIPVGYMLANIDGAGDTEIVVTWRRLSGSDPFQDLFLRVLNPDGSTRWSATVHDASSNTDTGITPPVWGDFDGDGDFEIGVYYAFGTGNTSFRAYDSNGASLFTTTVNTSALIVTGATAGIPAIASALLNTVNDTSYDLATGSLVVLLNGVTAPVLLDYSENAGSILTHVLLADVDVDGNLDVCGQEQDLAFCSFSSADNLPPTLNQSLEFTGYGISTAYGGPVCVNTTLTFTSQQCGGSVTLCNYQNDYTDDRERIVSNCGQDGSGNPLSDPDTRRLNGTYAAAAPSFGCLYNQTGYFSVRLYLQDDRNAGDFSQFNPQPVPVTVIDGTPGITCNIGPGTQAGSGTLVDTASASQAADDQVQNAIDQLGGGSTTFRFIIGLALVIGLVASALTLTQNASIIIFIALLGTIVFTLLGFIPGYVLALIMAAGFLVLMLKSILGGSSGSREG